MVKAKSSLFYSSEEKYLTGLLVHVLVTVGFDLNFIKLFKHATYTLHRNERLNLSGTQQICLTVKGVDLRSGSP